MPRPEALCFGSTSRISVKRWVDVHSNAPTSRPSGHSLSAGFHRDGALAYSIADIHSTAAHESSGLTNFCTFSKHLDLTYAFPRNGEFISKIVSSSRLVGKQPLLEYATLALVESGRSVPQYPGAGNRFAPNGSPGPRYRRRASLGARPNRPPPRWYRLGILRRQAGRSCQSRPAPSQPTRWQSREADRGDDHHPRAREVRRLAVRRLKNSFLWLAVVPIFTSDHDRKLYAEWQT
jgi:hypothetical protein